MKCLYKYRDVRVCEKEDVNEFCSIHFNTYQARRYKKIIKIDDKSFVSINGKVTYCIDNNYIAKPLNHRDILSLENNNYLVDSIIKDIVNVKTCKKEEEEPDLNNELLYKGDV